MSGFILNDEDISGAKEFSTGYVPRPLQYELHRRLNRFNVIVCHRRFGKTILSVNHLIDRALRCTNQMPQFAYVAPTFGQAKRVVWNQLKHYMQNIPGVEFNEADLRVDIPANKSKIMLLSAENPVSMKGIYLDGVVLDEYAEMNPTAWSEVIRPTLSDRKGWANFIGTPKGQNNFYKLYEYAKSGVDPEWFGALYKASETKIIDQSELDSAKRTMGEEEYEQEYECSFNAALVGAYFGKELAKAEKEGRIAAVPVESGLNVDLYFDLGIDDLTSVWFVQSRRNVHRIVDYYSICGASIPEIVRDIREKGYTLGEWVLPHDAKARSLQTGKTQEQAFWNLKCRPTRIVPRVGTKRESINAARMVLSSCYFDATRCKKGLDALTNYQRKWNPKNNVFEESPLHNWASNGADAFQCFALGTRGESGDSGVNDRRYGSQQGGYQAETSYNPFKRGR